MGLVYKLFFKLVFDDVLIFCYFLEDIINYVNVYIKKYDRYYYYVLYFRDYF